MPKHAKYFSPSKADTWLSCTASPQFVESLDLTERTSAAMEEGTAAHLLLEWSLTKRKHPRAFKGKALGGPYTATDDMIRFVGLVYDWCQQYVLDGYTLTAERSLQIACTGDTGTTDISLWHPETHHLIIADLKYGKGKIVDPFKNRQMRLYACGTCDADKLWPVMERLTLVVWQPRVSEEPAVWEDRPAMLRNFRDQVAAIVRQIQTGKGVFAPGEKACQWCPAKGACEAFAKHASAVAGLEFDRLITEAGVNTPSCDALSVPDIVNIYRNAGQVQAWLKAVSAHLYNLALANKPIPGLKLVEGKSDRKWTDTGDVMEALHRLGYTADQYAPRKLAGLGDVGALFEKKTARDLFMKTWTEKPKGKPTLVSEDDKRPAMSLSAADDFAGVPDDE
jgi:hypothetical protein